MPFLLVDLHAPTVTRHAHGVGDLPFERRRQILAAMMGTVRFQ